jgi:hypothetical protein
METAINQVLSTDLEMLSIGAIGSPDGTNYKPLYAGDFEFQLNHWPGNQSASAISINSLTLNTANNYYAVPFILNQTTTVNRLAMYVTLSGSPNLSIRGGVMEYDQSTGFVTQNSSTGVITFVAGANTTLTDTGTAVNFIAGQYTVFAFTSNVTLNANTWYAAGYTVSAYTAGAVTTATFPSNSSLTTKRFPLNLSRTGASTQTQTTGRGGVLLGFFDGTSYNYPIGEYYPGGSGSININPTPTTQNQVGAKFEINLPQNELYLSKILLGQAAINTSHEVVCKIYPNISATSSIATSTLMSTSFCRTNGVIRNRMYYFSPPVRLKAYRTYYAMWEITNGLATTVLPTQFNRLYSGVTTTYQYQFNDSLNQVFYRVNTSSPSLSSSNGYIVPMVLFFDYFRNTPSPMVTT